MISVLARCLAGLTTLAVALLGSPAARAFALPPAATPARASGLWLIDENMAPSARGPAVRTRKVWRVCLDHKADRALHELDAWEDRARAAADGLRCDDPVYALTDRSLTSTMRCGGASLASRADITATLTRTTHFASNQEVRSETVMDGGGHGRGRMVSTMRRTGPCPDSMKPGARLLLHWTVNGQETLKGRMRGNIFQQLDEYGRVTAR